MTPGPGEAHLRWLLPASVFVAGGVVMILELVGPRLLSGSVEADSRSWAALVAVTLLALALGSWLGGKFADRDPSPASFFRILLLSVVLTVVLPMLCDPAIRLAGPLGPGGRVLAGAALVFLPPLTLLGMVPPFAVRLLARALDSVGATAGHLGATSTAGSLAGTLLAGFLPVSHPVGRALVLAGGASLLLLVLVHWGIPRSGAPHETRSPNIWRRSPR
jgi:MFS family permease